VTPAALPVLDLRATAPVRRVAPPRPRLVLVRDEAKVDEAKVRLRAAGPADVVAVHALLEQFVAEGALLPRTQAQVAAMIGDFVVATDATGIVGCGALRRYSADLFEIVALAVAPALHGAGVGRRVVTALVEQARVAGAARVLALTLQDAFFHRIGFRTTTTAAFPQKVAADCSTCARRHACAEIAVVLPLK
jgi:amino-acid N-acetyltransferase